MKRVKWTTNKLFHASGLTSFIKPFLKSFTTLTNKNKRFKCLPEVFSSDCHINKFTQVLTIVINLLKNTGNPLCKRGDL